MKFFEVFEVLEVFEVELVGLGEIVEIIEIERNSQRLSLILLEVTTRTRKEWPPVDHGHPFRIWPW